MKKNEIALLILIVSVSLGLGYFVGQSLLGNKVSQAVTVETAEKISGTVEEPNNKIFNSAALNPTVPVRIGDSTNQSPFSN